VPNDGAIRNDNQYTFVEAVIFTPKK
jgi:hypothetical protein